MTTEDRRVGKLLPSPVVPETTVCFKIVVPNAVQYRAALLGQLSILGDWHTWDHPTDGTVCIDCETAAQLWRNALYNAVWSEECEEDVNCDDVANCIETNELVQEAIANQIDTNEAIQQSIADQVATNPAIVNNVYNTTVVGAPMSSSQRDTPVSVATGCDPDVLFGSVTSILDQLHTNNQDFLEVIQLTDNVQQRLSKVIKAIPLLNEVPADEALDFLSQMTIEIKENYDAQWTTSLKDEYRCDLFCIAKDKPSCELTFQDMVEYWNNRIGTSLEPINFFQALVTYFIAGTWSGTTVVDIMTLIQLSAWQQASSWTGITLRSLETVGLLGANSPDPDWALLCEDCSEEVTCQDFREGLGGWLAPFDSGYVVGQGFGPAPWNTRRIVISKNLLNNIKPVIRIRLTFNMAWDGWVSVRPFSGASSPRTNGNKAIWDISGISVLNAINVDCGRRDDLPGPFPSSLRLETVCYYYAD